MRKQSVYNNKTQNMFTAYEVKSVEGKRKKYLAKRNYRLSMENYLEDDMEYEPTTLFEEQYEAREKERLLREEADGHYPAWEALNSDQLIRAIKLLRRDERELIYRYIFEEKSFAEIGAEFGESSNKIQNRYYYAIKKIRNWMRGGIL